MSICAVCREGSMYDEEAGEYEVGVAQLECGHAFHKECLAGWFKQVCPLCNAPQHKVKVTGTLPSVDEKTSPEKASPEVLIDQGWFTNLTASVYIQPDALLSMNHSRTVVCYDDV